MRSIPIVAVLSTVALIASCDQDGPPTVTGPDAASMKLSAGESWVLTTYYWDNGWVRQTALNGAHLAADLRIGFNAHNWEPGFPGFRAVFDNARAWGETDLPQGLIDDFGGTSISQVWQEGGGTCASWGQGAELCLDEANGVVVVEVDQGSNSGLNHMAGLTTAPVIHGEFDVQIDFSVDPAFHSAPSGQANLALCVWDEFWDNAICIELDSDWYETWIGIDQQTPMPLGRLAGRTFTDDVEGTLRITRTRIKKGAVVESVMGSGSRDVIEQEGDWRTFSFTAQRYSDGTVAGHWERIRRQDGNAADSKSQGIVTCFAIVDNQVWLGGYATAGLYSEQPDNWVAWRVKDNGQGGGDAPDQISLQGTGGVPGYAAWFCAHKPETFELRDIAAGDIRITR